jgi:hypothetical protein
MRTASDCRRLSRGMKSSRIRRTQRLASLRPRTAGAALQRRGLADRSCSLECSLDHYA